jgi:hypothetical protein
LSLRESLRSPGNTHRYVNVADGRAVFVRYTSAESQISSIERGKRRNRQNYGPATKYNPHGNLQIYSMRPILWLAPGSGLGCTLVVGFRSVAALLFFGSCCWAQNTYEFGGAIGYGIYRDGSIFGPGVDVQAGIRNRFAAGVVLGEDLYRYVSGEIRYLYQDGHPYLLANGVRTDIQGQSQAITYDMLFHFRNREHKFRPFLAAGLGMKGYIIAGPAPYPQPVPNIATLTTTDQWKFATAVGGGVKYRIQGHILLRLDFLDYITTFPRQQIMPAPHNTARGIFEQFTPLFGVSYSF